MIKNEALGMIETKGLIGSIEAAEIGRASCRERV